MPVLNNLKFQIVGSLIVAGKAIMMEKTNTIKVECRIFIIVHIVKAKLPIFNPFVFLSWLNNSIEQKFFSTEFPIYSKSSKGSR